MIRASGSDARPTRPIAPGALTVALAAYFVAVWGAGFVATRIALQYAAPFTYIGVRYAIAFLVAWLAFGRRARWPTRRAGWGHAVVAGLLSHAGYLGGSHYAQRWGLAAGVTALVLALQPLLTAVVVSRWLGERLTKLQQAGIVVGLAGVALVVARRSGIGLGIGSGMGSGMGSGGAIDVASLAAVAWALACVTAGTLYQRQFCADADLRSAICIHFAATAAVMLPLGAAFEGFAIAWRPEIAATLAYHVVLASIGAFTTLHVLLRRGQATGVTSLLYLTPPVAALGEWAIFGVVPSAAMWLGMALACVGVAMATRAPSLGRTVPAEGTP